MKQPPADPAVLDSLAGLTPEQRALLILRMRQKAARSAQAFELRPVPRDRELPLSFAQQRLWFMDQWQPRNPAYNITSATRLTGRLDLPALRWAMDEIVRRHESLRTSFELVDGQPVQIVHPPAPLPAGWVDLTALPEEGRSAEVRRLVEEEGERPFDLARDRLVRAALLCCGPDEHVAMASMHHIVSDGWSMAVFVAELGALYEARAAGRPSPLPELPVQYPDFAVWQREWLSGQALARREGATLFMVLLAALDTWLHRYSGATDLLIGTPVAGRNRAELEGLIGFFVNTLVLRADLAGDPPFPVLLARTREAAEGAEAHQDLPFEKLVEELRLERDPLRPLLVQVVLSFQNTPPVSTSLAGVELTGLDVTPRTARYDLLLSIRETGDGLAGYLEYSTDLFD